MWLRTSRKCHSLTWSPVSTCLLLRQFQCKYLCVCLGLNCRMSNVEKNQAIKYKKRNHLFDRVWPCVSFERHNDRAEKCHLTVSITTLSLHVQRVQKGHLCALLVSFGAIVWFVRIANHREFDLNHYRREQKIMLSDIWLCADAVKHVLRK